MDEKRLKEAVDRLLGEAAGTEHERLKARLGEWATSRGYEVQLGRLPSGVPDVMRGLDESPKQILIGDAKDSAHETADVFATWERIRGYMRDFAELIRSERIRGGMFAIATNSRRAAERWATTLSITAEFETLVSADGSDPNFVVEMLDEETFVTYW